MVEEVLAVLIDWAGDKEAIFNSFRCVRKNARKEPMG